MKKIFLLNFLLIFISSLYSQPERNNHPIVDAQIILKDFDSFWSYASRYIDFAKNFQVVDTNYNLIGKENFFKKLIFDSVLPLKLESSSIDTYLMYDIRKQSDPNIFSVLQQMGYKYYDYFLMEGKELPDFDFMDINGQTYNSEVIKNKIVVLKFWFINCVKCVEEFPKLNKLYDKYKKNKDIQFLSLAFEPASELKDFLKTNKLKYPVIPDRKNYLVNKLRMNYYPTHILINKEGKVVKVVNSYEELLPLLEYEVDR